MINLYGINIVPINYVQYKVPMQRDNSINKYTEKGRKEIHTGLECMNYETIKGIVNNPFYDETVELNDVIIPNCASQYGKCYVSETIVTSDNIDFMYKDNKIIDKDSYQNIIIIDKNIKILLLAKGCGIMNIRKKLKRKEDNRLLPLLNL